MKGRQPKPFFRLSAPVLGARGVSYPLERYDELLTVFRAIGVFYSPLAGQIPGPYKLHDFAWSGPFPFIKKHLSDMLLNAGVTGFSSNAVCLRDDSAPEQHKSEEYCFLSIQGRCDSLIPNRESHLQVSYRQYPGGNAYFYQGLESPPPGWSGHDVFLSHDSYSIGVSETVRSILRAQNAKGYRMVPLNKLESLEARSLEELEAL
jgi:hypothetical protein